MRTGKITRLVIALLCANSAALAQDYTQDNNTWRIPDYETTRAWGDIEYKGDPWVRNVSRPNTITKGLYNTHLSLWQSHGRYYNQTSKRWGWQRPNVFCTNEDLFTQTIVVPYLIPMLENAGATVFTPRERDWQRNEVIVDNDNMWGKQIGYKEHNDSHYWLNTNIKGFARHDGTYSDGENPFEAGTARMASTTRDARRQSTISYQPTIPEAGRYAVYVAYQTLPNSVSDAQYIIYHNSQKTVFNVNQQIGGGTWVYLGTFYFDNAVHPDNQVVLTNYSTQTGVVCGDAVRFGGGMGNIERGGLVSGLPRALEGARYYAQWAGAPYSIYRSKDGTDDYAEDINTRPFMTNWLAGGSVFMPASEGKKVPIELSLAIHSDAGYSRYDGSIIGSLAICTTNNNDFRLNTGVSRMMSYDFTDSLLANISHDIKIEYGKWSTRGIKDSNYAETRTPEIPSAIIETLSHQNFNDMLYGQDPNFRFTLARAIYKTILKFVASEHGRYCVVEPLAPNTFVVKLDNKGNATLSWSPTKDAAEPTANATSYNIYTSYADGGFDNGVNVAGTFHTVKLIPGYQYNFKVAAVNAGGESFPSETLSAFYEPNAEEMVLVVNGFHRLSAPAVVNNDSLQGFKLDDDIGVSYGVTAGWAGKQRNFDKTKIGVDGANGLGYGGDEMAGGFVAGNDFNYVSTHTEAIAATRKYSVVSCSSEAVISNTVRLGDYVCVDLILGLEKDDGHALRYYKTFPPKMQTELTRYVKNNGRLLVSGSYIGSDMTTPEEQQFLADVLKVGFAGTDSLNDNSVITGFDNRFNVIRKINSDHYAAINPDILVPLDNATGAIQYGDGYNAAVAYSDGFGRSFTIGFPFECVNSPYYRQVMMAEILKYLME